VLPAKARPDPAALALDPTVRHDRRGQAWPWPDGGGYADLVGMASNHARDAASGHDSRRHRRVHAQVDASGVNEVDAEEAPRRGISCGAWRRRGRQHNRSQASQSGDLFAPNSGEKESSAPGSIRPARSRVKTSRRDRNDKGHDRRVEGAGKPPTCRASGRQLETNIGNFEAVIVTYGRA